MVAVTSHPSWRGVLWRLIPLLLVPVCLSASTFPGEFRVTASYWALSLGAGAVFVLGRWWPATTAVLVSGFAVPLFAAEAWGLSGLIPYLGVLTLAEVATRCDRNLVVATVTATWLAAMVIGTWLDDHTPLWNAANAVAIAAGVGLPLLLGLYLRAQRRLAATYRERAADAEMRRLAAESAVRAQERTVMARELHDLVAHHMASIVVRVGVTEHVFEGLDPRVSAVLADVHDTAADALADIRRLQAALRDPALGEVAMIEPEAVWTEIEAAVARTRAAGFTVVSRCDRGVRGLDALARLTLLRVVQEALTNVMKHSDRGDPVQVLVDGLDGGVTVRVENTVDDAASPTADGHGLIGMAERLDLVGGRLDVRRDPPRWVVEAWLPASSTTALGAPE